MNKIEILEKVKAHGDYVKEFIHDLGYQHIMTVLVGSQNYGLDSENSDIDTFSFIMPSLNDLITGKQPLSFEISTNDGKCSVKDYRLAFNLLRKPSPNSVECFVSKYKYYESKYSKILEYFLDNEAPLRIITHANYCNMLNAIAGTARMLHGRNMTEGKKYSHCLRLEELAQKYLDCDANPFEYLLLSPENTRVARLAKFGGSDKTNEWYQQQCKVIADILTDKADTFVLSEAQRIYEDFSLKLIDSFESALFNQYLTLNGYRKKQNEKKN